MACLRGMPLVVASVFLGACAGSQIGAPPTQARALTLQVAELQMHLRNDTYRSAAHIGPDGENVFEQALFSFERMQIARNLDYEQWGDEDLVIEYARARALEKLRRYPDAVAAYARVAHKGSVLAKEALEARDVMRRFALEGAPAALESTTPEQDMALVEARIAAWDELIETYGSTSFGPLAREEGEAWEIMRVELFGRFKASDEAIAACNRLIERNRDSKLYAEHLIRLGDLHADSARRESLVLRTQQRTFNAQRYDRSIGAALAAYELAAEARRDGVRRQAQTRISTLLADHEGVRAHVR
jgi:tetratricopeptide (TPR) repeat protein